MGCNGDCGITVHFPTVILFLWAAFLPSVQLYLAMGMSLLKLSLEFKMPQSCWHNTASRGACHPSRLLVQFLFSWDPGIKAKCKTHDGSWAGERGGCSGVRGYCHERSHFCKLFCKFGSSPVYKLCWRERLMYRDVRLCQSGAVFLHSSILCRIWEESLDYSVTCITACKSVYNQGLGSCPYL